MVRAWYMNEDVNSQFDQNYHGDYSLNDLESVIGVEHYRVINEIFLYQLLTTFVQFSPN